MKQYIKSIGQIVITVLFCSLLLASCIKKSNDNLDYVDPNIGGVGLLLQPTRPAVHLPNQMIRVYPSRKDYLDDQIRYFPLSLVSHRNGELFGVMPFTSGVKTLPPVSAWDENLEVTTPYFLSTWLVDNNITVEFTPGSKTGIFRFIFRDRNGRGVFFSGGGGTGWKQVSGNGFTSEQQFDGMKAFAYCTVDYESRLVDTIINGRRRQFAEFVGRGVESTEFRYSISFISSDQAIENFKSELENVSFDKLKADARATWSKVLGQINVKGGSEEDRERFYTALYRCYERMINIREGNHYYSNYDSIVHETDRDFYVDDWTWDTFLAHHPLRIILQPEKERDMIRSYVDMYQQSGWMPTFPVLYGDTPCMNGFHSTILILDAWRKGIRDFDVEKAYEGMRKNSTSATMLPWKNGEASVLDDFYREKGFFPALAPGEKETVKEVHSWEKRQAVAVTLGHSYDDWALGQMAKELDKKDDIALFGQKALNYKNLWNAGLGFFMPKDKDGNWIQIDPGWDGGMGGRDYYDENNGWTYLWQVQHDLPGLVDLMGGEDMFEKRLDQLFREDLGRSKYENWAKFPDFTGIVGQFSMGNEPSFFIPYLYNISGSPWKTQKRIRSLLGAWFPSNIFGIPGDEDGGGMSAFVVFSSMGFYPLTPGIPVYAIGSPVFERITIDLGGNKTIVIDAPGCSSVNKYIQKAWINGKPLDLPWITHEEIMSGGILKLEMGPYPNKNWGNGGLKDYEAVVESVLK
ncbi:MAG: GH92 family glycosyl hydrolase [Bacteroidales bacterium]